MVRLKNLEMHKIDNIPDHVLQEIVELAQLLMTEWAEMVKDTPCNIALGAFTFAHAAFLAHIIEEKELHKAAQMGAISLIKNVEMIMRQKGIPFVPVGEE